MQTLIAILLLASAVGFMLWKYVIKRFATSPDKDCGPDCKCG